MDAGDSPSTATASSRAISSKGPSSLQKAMDQSRSAMATGMERMAHGCAL